MQLANEIFTRLIRLKRLKHHKIQVINQGAIQLLSD